MKKKKLYLLLFFCNFLFAQNKTDEIKGLPNFSWNTMPLYMHVRKSTQFTDAEIEYLAKYPLITFEKTTGSKDLGSTEKGIVFAANKVKKINPETKILYYRNVVINWQSYKEDQRFLQENKDALLRNSKGELVYMRNNITPFFDISKKKVRDYWLKNITKIAKNQSIDGLFMDANIKVLSDAFFTSRVGAPKQKAIKEGYFSMMEKLKCNLGKDNLLIANIIRVRPEYDDAGVSFLKYFDGSYIEGFDNPTSNMSYTEYLSKGIDAVQKSARAGNIIAMSMGIGEADVTHVKGIDDVRKKINDKFSERLDYLLAIFLVCAEKHSYVYPHDGYSVNFNKRINENDSSVWMKTYPQYQNKLGKPLSHAVKNGFIYTRSFEHLDVWLDIENKKSKLTWKK